MSMNPVAVAGARIPERRSHLLRLLAQAPVLSRSPHCAEPVRLLFERLHYLLDALGNLPRTLAEADDDEVVRLLHQHRAHLDQFLCGTLEEVVGERFRAAVEADPRLLELEPALFDFVAQLQRAARQRLRARGISRIVASPGSLIDLIHVIPGPGAVPTREADWDGRIAAIAPGNGGYRLRQRVAVPAIAALFEYQPGLQAEASAAG